MWRAATVAMVVATGCGPGTVRIDSTRTGIPTPGDDDDATDTAPIDTGRPTAGDTGTAGPPVCGYVGQWKAWAYRCDPGNGGFELPWTWDVDLVTLADEPDAGVLPLCQVTIRRDEDGAHYTAQAGFALDGVAPPTPTGGNVGALLVQLYGWPAFLCGDGSAWAADGQPGPALLLDPEPIATGSR